MRASQRKFGSLENLALRENSALHFIFFFPSPSSFLLVRRSKGRNGALLSFLLLLLRSLSSLVGFSSLDARAHALVAPSHHTHTHTQILGRRAKVAFLGGVVFGRG